MGVMQLCTVCKLLRGVCMYHLCAVVGMEPASKASASLQVERESAASCRDAGIRALSSTAWCPAQAFRVAAHRWHDVWVSHIQGRDTAQDLRMNAKHWCLHMVDQLTSGSSLKGTCLSAGTGALVLIAGRWLMRRCTPPASVGASLEECTASCARLQSS